MTGTPSEVAGTFSDIMRMNTEKERSRVTPMDIFSPDSGGSLKTSSTRTDSMMLGRIMFIIKYKGFLLR